MPLSQNAVVDNYDLGLPASTGEVARFAVKRGGLVAIRLESSGAEGNGTVNFEVSNDGTTFVAYAGGSLTGLTVKNYGNPVDTVMQLRQGRDQFFRITGSGGVRIQCQLRHPGNVDIRKI